MTKTSETLKKTGKKPDRSRRLAAALRENLRRRKAQERQRGQMATPDAGDEPKSS